MYKLKIKKYILILIVYFLLFIPITKYIELQFGSFDMFMFFINYVLIGIVFIWIYSLIIIKKFLLSVALVFFSGYIVLEMLYIIDRANIERIIDVREKLLFLALGYIFITIGLINVVSSFYRMHSRMKKIAYLDQLTDLPNRAASLDFLKHQNELLEDDDHLCVSIVNMDDFKNMNDNFGRAFGDKVVMEYANILRQNNKSEDYIGRLASDEFIIIATSFNNEDEVMNYYKKLVKKLNDPVTIENHHIVLSTSIGVSCFDGFKTDNYMDYLRKSNLSLQYLKKTGKNNFLIYNDSISKEIGQENKIKDCLITAIDNNEIEIHYQPIIPLKDSEILSFEALARWKKDEGYMNTQYFIKIAEKYGLITYLDYYILNKVCQEARLYIKENRLFSVNISIRTLLEKNVVETIKNIVVHNKVPIENLCIEITETAFTDREDDIMPKINELKALGFKISIDDFGIGYSSLSRIKYLDVDYIKIDKLFIDGIGLDKDDEFLVKEMINIGKIKGASIVAEGVESKYQADYLKNNNCDKIQGYYFAKPMNIEDLEVYIEDYSINYESEEA